jgi:hypothetical protein
MNNNPPPLSSDELARWFHSSPDEYGLWFERTQKCADNLQCVLTELLTCFDMMREHGPQLAKSTQDFMDYKEYGVHRDQLAMWLQQIAARARSR